MSDLLLKAVKKIKTLSDKEQENIAELLLEEFGWDFSYKDSQKELTVLANEALDEYRKGKTKPLSFK